MKNRLMLDIMYELLWFAFAGIAAYLLILPVRSEIGQPLFLYLLGALFLAFTYFRFIAFMLRSILLRSVWVKIGLFILNVPVFFFMLNQYFTYNHVVDDYNYTLASTIFQEIRSGTEVNDLIYIHNLVIFSGTVTLLLIILLQIRIIYAIFKLRQLDKYLKNQ